MDMSKPKTVEISVARPEGWEDLHQDLVAERAIAAGWSYEVVRDDGTLVVIAVDLPEEYERLSVRTVVKEAITPFYQKLVRGM
jgi:hypothetical protein